MAEIKVPPYMQIYTDRINAKRKNFRRWVVISDSPSGSYYREIATIKFKSDGTIQCSDSRFAPTELEASAIAKEIVESDLFPKSQHVEEHVLQRLQLKDKQAAYYFWNRDDDKVVMVQERIELDNGGKAYIPHTFFSDGEWHCMEPDGLLPFWKPRHPKGPKKIMVHEGAKTAAYVQDLVDNQCPHPWLDELSEYEHWGMIGGALSPHRTNFSELRAVNPELVVYICDNDDEGVKVPPPFSKSYGKRMRRVRFDGYFPPKFDLADPMPKKYFSAEGKWIGPSLKNYMRGCTWATVEVPATGPGRPTFKTNPDFASDWFHSSAGHYMHHDRPHKTYNEDEFNNTCRSYSDVKDTSNYLKRCEESKVEGLAYLPAHPLLVATGNEYRFNTFVPSEIKPVQGDPKPFLDFMEYIFPEKEDCYKVQRWVATLLGRPDIKMIYALLMMSPEGAGKSTLALEILAKILGEHNVSEPDENTIVESEFNDWMAHKRLAICHEIYAGNSFAAANKLKNKITEPMVEINKKFQPRYKVENYCHIIAFSNDEIPMRIQSDKDRRWLIPRVECEGRPREYFVELRRWLGEEDGLGIILNWAQEFVKTDYVKPGEIAPETSRKYELAEDSMSPGMDIMATILDAVRETFNGDPVLFLDTDLVTAMRDWSTSSHDRQERPLHARKVAKLKGFSFSSKRQWWPDRNLSGRLISNKNSIEIKGESKRIEHLKAEDLKDTNLRLLNLPTESNKWRPL